MPHHEPASGTHAEDHQRLHAQIATLEQRLNDLETERTDQASKVLAINTITVSYLLLFAIAHLLDVLAETYYYHTYGEALTFPSFLVPFGLLVGIHALFIKRMYKWSLGRTHAQKRLAMGIMVLLSTLCYIVSVRLLRI